MDKGNSQPLINLLTFQEVAFWLRLRTMFFLWARQRGKSYLIAAKAIDRMLERAGRSCYFVSASIATGMQTDQVVLCITDAGSLYHGAAPSGV